MKGGRLIRPDAIALPYGNIIDDDNACFRFIKTRRQMYQLGIATRQCCKKGRMPRKSFDEWLKKSLELDDDTPLRSVINTL